VCVREREGVRGEGEGGGGACAHATQ